MSRCRCCWAAWISSTPTKRPGDCLTRWGWAIGLTIGRTSSPAASRNAAPPAGTVSVEVVEMATFWRGGQARLRNKCRGYRFQSYNSSPVMTAMQNVALPMLLGGMDLQHAHEKARGLLDAVGLGHRLDHRPDQLSGGQQQRVAIARS